jgi:pyruvate dehydrogenase E1 component alpha subunit
MPETSELLRAMVRIRCIEEALAEAYRDEQEMRTPVHFSIGQEATAVGVCAALRREDVVYGGHRCHAQYLAKGGDLDAMVAELYGKVTGCAAGRGGSVHLIDLAAGFGASSAILGEMISVAAGAAWSFARQGKKNVTATFFGDGAAEEGVFHETLNFAAVHRIPVIFVCENNGYSLSTPVAVRQPTGAGTDGITGWARGYGMPAVRVDGNDVDAVFEATSTAAQWCRDGNGPYFLELPTYRWREHVGPGWDNESAGRTQTVLDSWRRRCPIRRAAETLRTTRPEVDVEIAGWEAEFRAEVADAITLAKASAFPAVSTLLDDVYAS